MFRVCRSPRSISSALTRLPVFTVSTRRISDDAKQDIVKKLLAPVIVSVDELTHRRRELLRVTLHGFLPDTPEAAAQSRRQSTRQAQARFNPGHHLICFPTLKPTPDLLPDGTDTIHSPGEPWTQRLWAGGRVQFPRHNGGLHLSEPKILLAEYVRDVRVTGREGEEKIFVKIERRVANRTARRYVQEGHGLKRSSEDDTEGALIVETRDLCFLREPGDKTKFQRRKIKPPSEPDHSQTLLPTPALLFRFSALTFNAHAIHIDPEYTRNVYGLPNLIVHGPLSLTLMLEYMRRVLISVADQSPGTVPVVTEIDYRNLAPLFANEEMTICVKRKNVVLSSTSSNSAPLLETESGVDIRAGFPTPPSGEEASSVVTVDAQKPTLSEAESSQKEVTSTTKDFPQEWEIWIQTGQGDDASLAVRGTIKVEEFVEVKREQTNEVPKETKRKSSGRDRKGGKVTKHARGLFNEPGNPTEKGNAVLGKEAALLPKRPSDKTRLDERGRLKLERLEQAWAKYRIKKESLILNENSSYHPAKEGVPIRKPLTTPRYAEKNVTKDFPIKMVVPNQDLPSTFRRVTLQDLEARATSAERAIGAFERTLRMMLEGK